MEKSVSFLQEVAYIENTNKIKKFMKNKEERKTQAFEKAKLNNELVCCGCCYDDEILLEDTSSCRAGHLFCVDCIKRGAGVIVGEGGYRFPCMQENCKAEFSLLTLQKTLEPKIFGKMVQRMQEEEIQAAGIEGLEACPHCPYSAIPVPEDKIFKCLNPDCMKETCRKCKQPNHIPFKCDEIEVAEELKARIYIENRMTEALLRTCWRCSRSFIKEGGCNKMICACGAMLCYVCNQPVSDYKHFKEFEDSEGDKCPLYANDEKLNYERVKTEAERAKIKVLEENPNLKLKHDPSLLIKKSPLQRGAKTTP